MQNRPVCQCCGQLLRGQSLKGRFCKKCGKLKPFAAFASPFGMCQECKAAKREKAQSKRQQYFQDYYLRITKPKRHTRSKTIVKRDAVDRYMIELDEAIRAVKIPALEKERGEGEK